MYVCVGGEGDKKSFIISYIFVETGITKPTLQHLLEKPLLSPEGQRVHRLNKGRVERKKNNKCKKTVLTSD